MSFLSAYFIEKVCLPILSAVDAEIAALRKLWLWQKTKDEMANLQADNKILLQEARSERDQMLKEAREMKNAQS